VRVTLTNKGSEAYKPELYGDYITVERQIERNGTRNAYRLLAGDPERQNSLKMISNKKSELDTILDRFNIQVMVIIHKHACSTKKHEYALLGCMWNIMPC